MSHSLSSSRSITSLHHWLALLYLLYFNPSFKNQLLPSFLHCFSHLKLSFSSPILLLHPIDPNSSLLSKPHPDFTNQERNIRSTEAHGSNMLQFNQCTSERIKRAHSDALHSLLNDLFRDLKNCTLDDLLLSVNESEYVPSMPESTLKVWKKKWKVWMASLDIRKFHTSYIHDLIHNRLYMVSLTSSPKATSTPSCKLLYLASCSLTYLELHPQSPLPHRIYQIPCCLGLVGSRKPSLTGIEHVQEITSSIVQKGLITVSGGAKGIDQVLHKSTLRAKGSSLAILGFGLDHLSKPLQTLYAQGLGLMSPFHSSFTGSRWSFPKRNQEIARWVSGLIVVQASLNSGSLRTAREVLKRGKPVWVVAGSYRDPLYQGALQLLQEGALALTRPNSWLEHSIWKAVPMHQELNFSEVNDSKDIQKMKGLTTEKTPLPRLLPNHFSPLAHQLWQACSSQPETLDFLVWKAGVNRGEATLELMKLELEGWVMAKPSNRYIQSCPESSLC